MNDSACDRIRLAAMARMDGEPAMAGPDEIADHLRDCADCARTMAELEAVGGLLHGKVLQRQPVDLWDGLSSRLGAAPAPGAHPLRWSVLALAALLVGCKVMDLQIGLQVQLMAKLLALVTVGLLFARMGRGLLDLPARLPVAVRS